jgi:hypothetical protein
VSSLGLRASTPLSLQGGPDEQRCQELQLGPNLTGRLKTCVSLLDGHTRVRAPTPDELAGGTVDG